MLKKILYKALCVGFLFAFVFLNHGLTLANNTVLNTNFNSLNDVQSPAVGPSGTTNLEAGDFVAARSGNGADFSADTDYLLYPTDNIFIDGGAIPEKRVIDLWYKPNYNQDDDTRDHHIFGSTDNTFYLKHKNSDKSVMLFIYTKTLAPSYAYAVKSSINWEAGDWVHFQIFWYSAHITVPDPLTVIIPKMLINGKEAEAYGNGTYSGSVSPGDNLFVGNKDNVSSLSADGVMDDLYIYDEFWSPNISAVSPTTLDQGDQITISGTSFGPNENSVVTIGGSEATVISWTDTQIKAIVPSIDSGTKDVVVSTWGLVDSNTKTVVIGEAPAVTSLTVSGITSSSANINWTTSGSSKTKIQWGKTDSYGSSYSNASYSTSHTYSLTGLDPSTRYYFKIYVEDGYGDTGSTGGYSFVTDSSGLIINPGLSQDSISYIDSSATVTPVASTATIKPVLAQNTEDKVESVEIFGLNDIRARDDSDNVKVLEPNSETTILQGENLSFYGKTVPNTRVCLVFSDGEDSRICTTSDDEGNWVIIVKDIIPDDYKVWIEIPDSNAQSEKYNIRVLGSLSSNLKADKTSYISYGIILVLLAAVLSVVLYRKKAFKR